MFSGSELRILDANANRAREALRVMEDYARFALDHQPLQARLKSLRHDLVAALGAVLPDALLHRDTPGDVGTSTTTPAEAHRPDLESVVTAAGKRLGEALRVIEEVLKIGSPKSAAKVEAIRYGVYDLEQQIGRTLGRGRRFEHVRLYVLITESICRRPWMEAAEQAILGGADCLQLREKGLDGAELLCRAKQLVELCRHHGVLCIVNDRPDVAVLAGADGVHLGQDDLPAAQVRKLIGSHMLLGVSTHRIEQAQEAVLAGADYIGVGPIYRSTTRPRDVIAGLDYARQVSQRTGLPAVAIAGIDARNVDEVLSAGIKAVAVTAAVIGRDDIRSAAMELKAKLLERTDRNVCPTGSQ